MKNVLRGIIILFGIILVNMLIAACTPNSSMVRNDRDKYSKKNYDVENEIGRYDYEYEEEIPDELQTNKRNSRENKRNFKESRDQYVKKIEDEIGESFTHKENQYVQGSSHSNDIFYQTGMASWYGRKFHGKVTASGERFNMNKLTAAHRVLPFGTEILVKNLDNNREVKVIINDRGPYKDGLILDVSYAAARRLGMVTNDNAEVGIKILRNNQKKNEYSHRATSLDNEIEPVVGRSRRDAVNNYNNYNLEEYTSTRYSIQAGAFYSRRNAKSLKKQLQELLDNPVVMVHDDDMYKVRIMGIRSRDEANRYKDLLEIEGISSFLHINTE